jgi:hypothetical protein
VSFDDGGGVLQLEEETWEVRCGPKGMGDGGAAELTKGRGKNGTAVAVRSAGMDTRLGTERRGATGCSWCACEGGTEGEKERAGDISDTFYQRRGRQGKEGGPGRSPQRRETGGERGGG